MVPRIVTVNGRTGEVTLNAGSITNKNNSNTSSNKNSDNNNSNNNEIGDEGDADGARRFRYDHVFDENCDQATLYSSTAAPIVTAVLAGYNGTVFAYGQTGTGKVNIIYTARLGSAWLCYCLIFDSND